MNRNDKTPRPAAQLQNRYSRLFGQLSIEGKGGVEGVDFVIESVVVDELPYSQVRF